jgi:hypothetical protein
MAVLPKPRLKTFDQTLADALNDMTLHGYDSQERVDFWTKKLEEAAHRIMMPPEKLEQQLRDYLNSIYTKQIDRGQIMQRHKGVGEYTIAKVRPQLREELERRKAAAFSLIKLNKTEEVEKMKRRFSGWASSVPKGGTSAGTKETKEGIRQSISGLSFRERRVLIDQGHKFQSAVSEIVASGGGAIAGIWHSHWRKPGYNYREDHKERDKEIYVVRGNWAIEKGFMQKGSNSHPYTDAITKPGEEINCTCFYEWIYNPSELPKDMLTDLGRRELARVEKEIREMA